jgi:zinc finger FYVE domain-containing protein 26
MATTSDKVSDKIGTPLQDGDAVNRLEVIIYNLISIGAWESARGQLQALAISTTGRDKAKDILKAIILNPKSFWNESLAVPSIDHLASLALQDYIELFPDNLAEIPSSLEDQFNFNLLLYTSRLCDGYSPQISDWLKGYYLSHVISRSTSSISLHTFNQTVLGFIRTLLLSHPPIAHSLISYLIIKDDPHYLPNNESLQLLYISCIDIYWSEIESCDDDVKKKELIDKINLMLSLVDPQGDMSKLLKKLDNLLVRLIQSQVKIEDNLAFTFESIYGCFIGRSSPILIQRFQDIEEFMKGYIGKGPATIVSRDEEDNNDDRWKVEFYKCLRKNRHFLEKTLDVGLKLITNGQLDKLVELMEDSTYHRLKPLLLLLGWDRYSDTGSGQKLLNILWPSSDISEPVLYNGCCKLAFQIGLVDWCLQKARPFLPDSSSLPSSAGDVFQGLKSHSILYVLHHSTPLSSLNPTEVIEILKLRPDSSSLTKPLSPTFQNLEITSPLKSNSSASLLPEQERDINTFRGFHCLKMILEAIWHSVLLANGLFESKEKGNPSETNEAADGDKPKAVRKLDLDESNIESSVIKTKCDSSYDKEVTQRLSDAKIHLSSIFPLHFRLEILENIFSLLFLSSEDIQVFNEVKAAHDIVGSTQSLNSKSSEAESDSLNTNTTFIKKQKGFLVDEKIAHDILQLLNDAIFELTAARFSLFSSNGGQGGSIDHISTGAMVSSISPSLLNQRSVKLQKQINEAKWRLELVSSKSGVSTSHASLSRPVGVSSDEDSLSDISEPEEEEKTEEKMTVRGKVKDQITRTDNSKGPSPRLPRSHRLSKPRSGSDGSKGGRPTAASTDEVYESSGHCADVEEPTPFSLIKKRKFRPRAGPTLSKLRKSSKNSTAQKGSGIIYQMLASPNSLLCKCLRYGNYHKGQEVVKMFNMEDTIEESLVQFSEQFEMVSRELADQSQSPTPHPSPSLTPKNSKGSKDNQSQALQAAILNASDHYPSLESLHRLLVPTTLSKMLFAGNEEIDSASLDTPLLESLTQNVPSLVMLDLLISNKINGQTAKKIVKMAVDRSMVALDSLPSDSHTSGRRSYQERSASQDKPSPRGPLSLLLTLSEVSGYFILPASTPDNAGLLSITSPHHLLFQFVLPLTIESVQYWKEFNNCYQEKREVVERVIQKSSTHSDPLLFLSSSQSPKDKTNDMIFTELIKAIELFPRHNPSLKPAADDRVYIQYIYYLIAYLTKFVQLLRNSLDLDSTQTCPSQLLCVLKESPIELIGRLVFEKSISPQRLEKFMSDLPHLKIVEVIVKCCCPSIPSTGNTTYVVHI